MSAFRLLHISIERIPSSQMLRQIIWWNNSLIRISLGGKDIQISIFLQDLDEIIPAPLPFWLCSIFSNQWRSQGLQNKAILSFWLEVGYYVLWVPCSVYVSVIPLDTITHVTTVSTAAFSRAHWNRGKSSHHVKSILLKPYANLQRGKHFNFCKH